MTDSTTSDVAPYLSAVFGDRPRVRPDLLISRELGRGPDRMHLVKAPGGKTFEVTVKECFLIRGLDGSRPLAELGAAYAARFGRRLGPAQWSQLLWLLSQRDLLETGPPSGTATRPPSGTDAPATGSAGTPGGPPVGVPGSGIRRLAAALGWAFSVPAGVAVGLGLTAMYACVVLASPRLWQDARPAFGDWRCVAGVVVVSYLSAMLHELAHGVAAVHFGCAGVRINLVALSCRVDDYQFLPSRAQQVAIAAVGGVLNSLVVAPFLLAWLLVPPGSAVHRFTAAVILVGVVQSLANYVPMAPLDGYKMLSHLLGMVALAPESRRYLWSRPRRWVSRHGARYPWQTRLALGFYGVGWHVATAATGAGVAYAGGRLLAPSWGRAAYAASTALVVLTIVLWLAGRPRRQLRTPPINPPHERRGDAAQR
ncbi:peptidase M50 [Micromonospora wenchangensis]|uniref:peptidase M50 n=1 Tax=Micromonospora wenchangensis TaxID=1185415 RepID=UPI003D7094CC